MIILTRAQDREAELLLARCDNPAAAWDTLDREFHGDVAAWLGWLRWLDEGGLRTE